MSKFNKRNVPGLEDCSESEEEDEILPIKKLCKEDEVLELDIPENEFLDEIKTPVKSENPIKSAKKKTNNVWGNVIEDEILNNQLNHVGMDKNKKVSRAVESYAIPRENKRKRRHKHEIVERQPVNNRLSKRKFDKSKDRSHVNIDPLVNTSSEIILEIAKHLKEPKIDIIERCYFALGLDRCLEFLYLTEDIEDCGGLLVVNGSRRRTPGGVYLHLIKESNDIREEDKQKIFISNVPIRRKRPIDFNSNGSPDECLPVLNGHNNINMDLNNEDLEEGEIL